MLGTWRGAKTRRVVAGLLAEAGLLVAAYLAYEAVRRIAAPDEDEATRRAMSLIHLEQRAGLFLEPDLQRHVLDHHWLVTLLNWVYIWGYLPVIAAVAIYLYIWHRPLYARYRNAFLVSGAAGLIVFAMLPVAPPRMFPELGFVDTVRERSAIYSAFDRSGFVNEFAAMPSFHVGWLLLVGLALIETSRDAARKAAGVLLPVLMLLTVILTANHYLADAGAGAVIVLLALAAVSLLGRSRSCARRPRSPLPPLNGR